MGDSVDGGDSIAVYAACKAAVIALTKAVAREVARYGINVNCISPGVVRTRVFERFPKEELDSIIKKTPLGRIGEPEDIANVALFLASEQSEWLTGQNICASGGLVMH
jgi:3-oxoacyl-[acyl-carrier protein] reductase